MTLRLNLKQAEAFVKKSDGYQWNGWDIEHFIPSPLAETKTNGAWRGRWGYLSTIPVNSEGKWVIEYRTPRR